MLRSALRVFVVLITLSGCTNGGGGIQVSDFEGVKDIDVYANKSIESKLLNGVGVSASKSGNQLGLTLSADMLLDKIEEYAQ